LKEYRRSERRRRRRRPKNRNKKRKRGAREKSMTERPSMVPIGTRMEPRSRGRTRSSMKRKM